MTMAERMRIQETMKYDAIIFDLFGTLVDNFGGGYAAALRKDGVLAELVGNRSEEFERLWGNDEAYKMRVTGIHATGADSVRSICEQMGLDPRPELLRRAQQARMEYLSEAITPRPNVTDTLESLRQMDLKLALMTVCTGEDVHFWTKTPLSPLFDEAVFSCNVGLDKPDPRFYATVCERLDTQAERCLYVGDGAGRELTGAQAVGMEAVLICAPHEEEIVMARDEARNWAGPRIEAISEVLALINL